MNPYIIVLWVALGFGSAWKIQDWRADAKEQKHAAQTLSNVRLSAAADIRRLDNVAAATDRATYRMAVLRRDADGARTALVGLSDAADSALRSAQDSQAACLERATTLSELLRTVAAAGGEVSAKADRHTSDVQTLTEAWPK